MIAVNKYVNRQHLLQYSLDEQLIHGMRVSNLAYQVAKELGEPEEFCHDLAVAGMLHDIGKEAVSGDLDDMDAPLIVEEIHYVRLHAQASYEILKKEGYKETILLAVRHHHENYDGSGYPCGIRGEEIPLSARIMAVADVYDALRSKRHYKDGFSKEKAMAIMKESRGTHFDAEIDDLFLEHIDEMEAVLDTGTDL